MATYRTPSGALVDNETGQVVQPAPGYSVQDYNQSISVTGLAENLKPLPVRTPSPQPVYPVSGLNAEVTAPELALTPPEEQAQDFSTQLQSLNERLLGESAYRAEQEQKQDIVGLTKTQKDLSAQLKALQNEALAIPVSIQQEFQGRGVTAAGVQPIQTARLRENAIRSLGVASLLEASRGNLTLAMDLVDRAVAQKYDPIKEEIAVKKANLDLILQSPAYSIADKNRAQRQKDLQDRRARAIAREEENLKVAQAMAAAAIKNNPGDQVVQIAAQQLLGLDPNDPAYLQKAFSLVGQYQSDPLSIQRELLEQQKLQLDIDEAPLRRQKILAEISKIERGIDGMDEGVLGLVNTVIGNPELFNQLTPTEKGKIAPYLNKLGFTAFGKPLSDTAIKEITQTETAIESVLELKDTIKGNEQYLGPIAGLQRLNPYSKARQVQADVDRIRQRVGKALEGGVLRKEDEEKYKKILATLSDTPDTAIYKINQLIKDLEREVSTYKKNQALAGRNVSEEPTDEMNDDEAYQEYLRMIGQ